MITVFFDYILFSIIYTHIYRFMKLFKVFKKEEKTQKKLKMFHMYFI